MAKPPSPPGKKANAVISGDNQGDATEDTHLSDSGVLTIQDSPAKEAHFQTQTTVGDYGTFSLAANGAWTYTLNNTLAQALNDNSSPTDSFTAVSVDGTTKVVSIALHGTNDAAVIGGNTTGTVTEDVGPADLLGTLTISDVDNDDAFVPMNWNFSTNGYGQVLLTADGHWDYELHQENPAVQALGAGESLLDYFTATAVDGTTQTVTITINGTNDAAVIGGETSGTVYEDNTGGPSSTSGLLTVNDVDGDDVFLEQVVQSSFGTLTIHSDGRYAYDLDNSNPEVQALGQGSTMVDRPVVTTADGTQESLTMTIVGADEPAGAPTQFDDGLHI